jgi:hypothetical protein
MLFHITSIAAAISEVKKAIANAILHESHYPRCEGTRPLRGPRDQKVISSSPDPRARATWQSTSDGGN